MTIKEMNHISGKLWNWKIFWDYTMLNRKGGFEATMTPRRSKCSSEIFPVSAICFSSFCYA